ncbi:MAG: RNA polymerase sigma factor [Actinomycetota bacterium]
MKPRVANAISALLHSTNLVLRPRRQRRRLVEREELMRLQTILEKERTLLLRRMLFAGSGRQEAEDIVQEAICRALESKISPDRLHCWLSKVVDNLRVDLFRYQDRTRRLALRLGQSERYFPIDDVEDTLFALELGRYVGELPAIQRRVIEAIASGFSLIQVAKATASTQRSVEGHLRRARIVLRKSAC